MIYEEASPWSECDIRTQSIREYIISWGLLQNNNEKSILEVHLEGKYRENLNA